MSEAEFGLRVFGTYGLIAVLYIAVVVVPVLWWLRRRRQ